MQLCFFKLDSVITKAKYIALHYQFTVYLCTHNMIHLCNYDFCEYFEPVVFQYKIPNHVRSEEKYRLLGILTFRSFPKSQI